VRTTDSGQSVMGIAVPQDLDGQAKALAGFPFAIGAASSLDHLLLVLLQVLHSDPADSLPGDDQLHDLRRAVAYLQSHDIA
jgi:hypothetical protein